MLEMQLIYIAFILPSSGTSFSLSVISLRTAVARTTLHHVVRHVGDGVNGNQTGINESTDGTGLGDGNGVGFVGTGNDTDTGKFDHLHPLHLSSLSPLTGPLLLLSKPWSRISSYASPGDGNTTMGSRNKIEIGDRITNINIPLNMSDIIAKGIDQARSKNGEGGLDMNIDISMRVRTAEQEGDNVRVLDGGSNQGLAKSVEIN
jgi:hypothetical protein